MRISDWSSDVCSSDLLVPLPLALGAEPGDGRAGRMDADLAGIEHADAQDVAIARRPGADDLGEEGDADAHQLTGLTARKGGALFLLLGAQRGIAGRLDRLLHGGGVVARSEEPPSELKTLKRHPY